MSPNTLRLIEDTEHFEDLYYLHPQTNRVCYACAQVTQDEDDLSVFYVEFEGYPEGFDREEQNEVKDQIRERLMPRCNGSFTLS